MILLQGLTILFSVVALVFLAAERPQGVAYAYAHMALSFATALTLAIMALVAARKQVDQGARPNVVSATLAHHMGLVWGWGALALLVTYATGIATWKEWPGFFAAFAVLGVVSHVLSWRLRVEAASGGPGRIYTYSRYLAMGQLLGMIIVMAGLVIDGKMVRFLSIQGENWQDWAANNYFFFGAFALAMISAYGLRALPAEKRMA